MKKHVSRNQFAGPIIFFFGLSVAAHALALVNITGFEFSISGLKQSELTVNIIHNPTNQTRINLKQKQLASINKVIEREEQDNVRNTLAENTNSHGTSNIKNLIKSDIKTKLLSSLSRHFEYPLQARQKGWQGSVILGFYLTSNGVLTNVRVLQSSGYNILDLSALNSLRQIKHVSNYQGNLGKNKVSMTLPVIYRLEDS